MTIQGPQIHLPKSCFRYFLDTCLSTLILELLKNSWFLLHIHLTDLQHTCLEITKKQQRSYDPSNLSKTIQNQNHQYLLIPRANSPPKKVENEVPGPPQLSPRMLPNAPGTPQDPADLQGTPQDHSRAPRGRSQDPSRTPQDKPQRPRSTPRDPAQSFQNSLEAFPGYLRH